jgi:seryl-tRNA synthetase
LRLLYWLGLSSEFFGENNVKVEMIVAIAALVTSVGAIASSAAAFISMRDTLRHLQAQTNKLNAEEKKTRFEIELEMLDKVISYWKELSDNLSARVLLLESRFAEAQEEQRRTDRALEYLIGKVIDQYREYVKVSRDIREGKIAGGA